MEAMRRAYVLISSMVGSEGEVLGEVREIPEVREAYAVYGVYDIMAVVEAETIQGINDVVFSKIRCVDNVSSVLILVCV